MRWIDKLGQAQRAVVVVAIGVAFLALGNYLPLLGQRGYAFGWTGYAPLSAVLGWPGWLHLVVWLALTCVWAAVSIWLLRPAAHDDSG